MYREENLTVDLKVKEYNALRLKQMDSTKLIVKLIDDSIPIDLTNLDVDIIFTKPNQKIVMQSNNITVDNNRISIILLDDCLRMSGKAKIEIELKKNTEIVSSFFIPIFIEPTSKENIQSDNTPNYIETLEDAIVLEKERQKAETLRKNAEENRIQNEESRNSAEEARITNETTRESAEEIRSNNETSRQEAETQRTNNETNRISAESARVEAENKRTEEFKKIKEDLVSVDVKDVADLKKAIIIQSAIIKTTDTIPENTNYEIPIKYEVGNNSLEINYMGEKLVKNEHYVEVGEVGTKSNIIQFYDWGQAVPVDRIIEFVVRGDYSE